MGILTLVVLSIKFDYFIIAFIHLYERTSKFNYLQREEAES